MTISAGFRDKLRTKLVDLRSATLDRMSRTAEVIPEETHPAGDQEAVAADGLDVEICFEKNHEELLRAVEDSLLRLDRGEFGICQGCRRPIPQARLEVVPHAACCVECERAHEQGDGP